MNNISYKNVILGLNKNSTLPYKESGHIKYTSNSQTTSGTLNNTFNQLIDNDRFIERNLNGVTSYQYGPKSDDSEKIYYGADGYKYYKDENGQLAIYRKIENDLNSDIRNKIDGNAHFICQWGAYYFCGMDSGLKYSTDLETWSTIPLRAVRGYYQTDSMMIVAAQDGVYLVQIEEGAVAVSRVNSTQLVECRCVGVSDTNFIYVGCSDGLYRAYFANYFRGSEIAFDKLEIRRKYIEGTERHDVVVNDIIEIDGQTYLAAQDSIYKDKTETTLVGYERWLDSENVNAVVRAGSYTFVGTDRNLFARYDESDTFYALSAGPVQVYSAVEDNDHAYFGTNVGLISIDMSNGKVLDPIDDYPVNKELKNVTVLKIMRDKGKRRVYGINGTTSFILGQSIDEYEPILSGVVQTDIHRMNGDDHVYISTPNQLYYLKTESNTEQLETIKRLDEFNDELTIGVIQAGARTIAFGQHYVADVNDRERSIDVEQTIKTIMYVGKYKDHLDVILIFTVSGVKMWDLDLDVVEDTQNADCITSVVRQGQYYFAVVYSEKKYLIREYDNNLVFLRQFGLRSDDDDAEAFIDGEYVYVFQHDGQNQVYRYHISDAGLYSHFSGDYVNVKGIYDNGSDQILIASADGLRYSQIVSDDIDEGGSSVVMSELNDSLKLGINKLEHVGNDDIGNPSYDCYEIAGPEGVTKVAFEYIDGRPDYSKYTTSQPYSEGEVFSKVYLGGLYNLIQVNNDQFVVRTPDYGKLSCSLSDEVLYDGNNCDLYYYVDGAVLYRDYSIYLGILNAAGKIATRTKLSCLTEVQASTIRRIIDIDEQFVLFTDDGISSLVGSSYKTVNRVANLCELTGVSYDTITRISFNDDTIKPTDEQLLFGVNDVVHALYYDTSGKLCHRVLLDDMTGTGDVLGIDKITVDTDAGKDLFVWVFFRDEAIEYKWSGYSSDPVLTGRVKRFKTYSIKNGYVSGATADGDRKFVLYTEDDSVIETTLDDGHTTIMDESTGVVRSNNDYSTQSFFFILQTDGSMYSYNADGCLYRITEKLNAKSIQMADRSGRYVGLFSDNKLKVVSYSFDKEFSITVDRAIQDVTEYGNGLVFLTDGKLYYSDETDYTKFGSSSLKEILSNGNFQNRDIIRVIAHGGFVYAFTKDKQYRLVLVECQVAGCEIMGMSDVAQDFEVDNAILYKDTVAYKGHKLDLFDKLNGITRDGEFLYCDAQNVYYLETILNIRNLILDTAYSLYVNAMHYCDGFVAFSNESGVYRLSDGERGDILKSREYELTGNIKDFVYTSDECFFKTGDTWKKKLSTGKNYNTGIGKSINGILRTSKGTDVMIRNDGSFSITYDTYTHTEIVDQMEYLRGTNVRRVYGSYGNPKLLVRTGSGRNLVTFYRDDDRISEPIKCVIRLKGYDSDTTISDFGEITFSTDNSVATTVVEGDTYIRIGDGSFNYIPIDIKSINEIVKNGSYYLCTSDGIIKFDSYGSLDYFINPYISTNDIGYGKFVKIGDAVYVCGQYGIYIMYDDVPVRVSQSKYNSEICTFSKDDETGRYLIPVKNFVYDTNNIRLFKTQKFSIDDVSLIKQVLKRNSKDYLFATDKGLYKTNYSYTVENDIQKFSVQDAIEVYQSMIEYINYYYTTWYNTHISQYHKDGSNTDLLNNGYIDVNFEDISESWQSHQMCSDYIATENDIVFEIEDATNDDGDIQAYSSNANQTLSGLALDDIPLSYILKRWKSGMCELYVYLTTTNTYYLPFNEGVPNCKVDQDEKVVRYSLYGIDTVNTEDRAQTSKIGDHYTNIQLNIMSSYCFMDCIQDIQINGNSLPLNIYKDRDGLVDQASQNLYQSFIEPSVVDSCDISKTDENGCYNFRFRCFGSDAQAIRIQFYDSKHRYGGNSYMVVFDPNGGSGTMKSQRFAMGQESKLRKNKFTKKVSGQARVFLGWSLTKQNDNTQPMFQDESQFSEAIAGITVASGESVTLYAVWLSYDFGNGNSTQIVIDSNKNEFIIKEADTFNDDKIGNQVIIDFGD